MSIGTVAHYQGLIMPDIFQTILSIHELERVVLRSYGKVVNATRVRYSLFTKFHCKDLRTRVEQAMKSLSNKQLGYFIDGRFYKSPHLTAAQLAQYQIKPDFYLSRLAPAAHKRGFSIGKVKEMDILHIYNTLFKVNETTL